MDDRVRVRELEKSHDPAKHLIFVVLKKGLETHSLEFKGSLYFFLAFYLLWLIFLLTVSSAPTEAEKESWRDSVNKIVCLRINDTAATPSSPLPSHSHSHQQSSGSPSLGVSRPRTQAGLKSPRAVLEQVEQPQPLSPRDRPPNQSPADVWRGGKVLPTPKGFSTYYLLSTHPRVWNKHFVDPL